jgi:hypothetical protein
LRGAQRLNQHLLPDGRIAKNRASAREVMNGQNRSRRATGRTDEKSPLSGASFREYRHADSNVDEGGDKPLD